ncbi:MAG TPA: site-2 protease family protein [Pyrinomonadaceae bacterium]|nr:site-2 protease family protein [Pyrinomonadaceae bacterium]
MLKQYEALPPFSEHHAPLFFQPSLRPRRLPLPSMREWGRHALLFLLTALTATFAGIVLAAPNVEPALADPVRPLDYLTYVPLYYALSIWVLLQEVVRQPALLAQGAKFAAALLAILAAHEFGHYLACRRYRVFATLPFFLPAPPLFLAGTFGAFIKIKSPIPSRRALFDIGLAGPLAGFLVALPVAALGFLTARPLEKAILEGLYFHDPLLYQGLGLIFGIDPANMAGNPFWFAGWVGLLVTSLNLLPVGQLDGGHAIYALFGPRIHYWVSRFALLAMCSLTLFGLLHHGTPSGLLYTILLFFVLRAGHPPLDEQSETLGRGRVVIAALTLLIFALCFLPFPISVF